jgi:hypothetical protein
VLVGHDCGAGDVSAGYVHKDIHAAQLGYHFMGNAFHCSGVHNIARVGLSLGTKLFKNLRNLFLPVHKGNHNGSFRCEMTGDGTAQYAGCTCDNSDFTFY